MSFFVVVIGITFMECASRRVVIFSGDYYTKPARLWMWIVIVDWDMGEMTMVLVEGEDGG